MILLIPTLVFRFELSLFPNESGSQHGPCIGRFRPQGHSVPSGSLLLMSSCNSYLYVWEDLLTKCEIPTIFTGYTHS